MGSRIYHQPGVRGRRTAKSVALRFLRGGLLGLEPGDLRLLRRNPKLLTEFIRSIDHTSACAIAFLTGMAEPAKSEMHPVGRAALLEKGRSHPGEILWHHHMKPLRMSIRAAAAHIGVSRHTLTGILNCERPVTPDMAHRLAKAFSTSAELWTNLQQRYDRQRLRWHKWRSDPHPRFAADARRRTQVLRDVLRELAAPRSQPR